MSVILDALRKLDREKSSRRIGASNIALEILRPDPPHPGKKIPMSIASFSLTAIAAAAITYTVIVWSGLLSKSSVPLTTNPPAPNQQVTSLSQEPGLPSKSLPPTLVNPPASNQQVTLAPPSPQTIHDAQEEIGRVSTKTQVQAETKTSGTFLGEEKQNQNVMPGKVETDSQTIQGTIEHNQTTSAATPPSLKLSAIVWYEDPSNRFAVINGTIATEGSMIEGAKVLEIYPTRVRLLHNDHPFEISMSP